MSRTLSIIGIAITLGYFAILGFIFNGRLTEILLMRPNEIGDLLAGMFGPLAILWLILGFFQQGVELRQNTKAPELQAAELQNSVTQQKNLVDMTKQQLELEKSLHRPSFGINLINRHDETIGCDLINLGGDAYNIRILCSNGFCDSEKRLDTHLFRNGVRSMELNYIAMPSNADVTQIKQEYWVKVEFDDLKGQPGAEIFDYQRPSDSDDGIFTKRHALQ